jgi:glycosyltransferase involved in cell wall biosynthesis
MTAAGWAPFPLSAEAAARAREDVRHALQIPKSALTIGIVGSLAWNRRVGYCYGFELVCAMTRLNRPDVHAIIVGDGDGRPRLEQLAGTALGRTIHLTGRVPRERVPHYLAALDLASLPQSADRVGSFRYTTKLSEYLAAGLPVVTGQVPLAYDLDTGWLWRLVGGKPWGTEYLVALTRLLGSLTGAEVLARRAAIPSFISEFDRERQIERVTAFLSDILCGRGISSVTP